MFLNSCVKEGKVIYSVNNGRNFNALNSISEETINICKKFAYEMSFGSKGEHRANRSGGKNRRRKGEIFCDAFNGKLGEFAVHQFFSSNNIHFPKPDLNIYGLGKWDDTDFHYNGYYIAVKTTKHFGNLLLLEQEDWDQNGHYKPNYDSEFKGKYDAIILVRINSDIVKRFKINKKYYSDFINESELNKIFFQFKCSYDIPGYASQSMLQNAINNKQLIEQGSYLGEKTHMDATNYYIQSGDLQNINNLIIQLENTDNQTKLKPIV